jgi:hypothetical protein
VEDMSIVVDIARGAAVVGLVTVLVVGAVLLGVAASLAYWAWADRSVETAGVGSTGAAVRPSARTAGVFTLLAVVAMVGSGVLLQLIR